jgi:RNA polymerase sigma-70 factor (ECF subfamily)
LSAGAPSRVIDFPSPGSASDVSPSTPIETAPLSLAELFERYYDFVWRSLRRLGMSEGDADDAAQEVFLVASRRLPDIQGGRERSFLFGTALRVTAGSRRTSARQREIRDERAFDGAMASDPDPASALDQRRAREILGQILDAMPLDQRAVFVLYELEGLTMAEIASDLDLAAGTVASRLRRAREIYQAAVSRLQARDRRERDMP